MKTKKKPQNLVKVPREIKRGENSGAITAAEAWKEAEKFHNRLQDEMREDIQKVFLKEKASIEQRLSASPERSLLFEKIYNDYAALLLTPNPRKPTPHELRTKNFFFRKYVQSHIVDGSMPSIARPHKINGTFIKDLPTADGVKRTYIREAEFSIPNREREWTIECEASYRIYKWLKTECPNEQPEKKLTKRDLGILLQRQSEIPASEIREAFCEDLAKHFSYWTGKRIGKDIRKKYIEAEGIKVIPESIKTFLQDPQQAITLLKKSYPLPK